MVIGLYVAALADPHFRLLFSWKEIAEGWDRVCISMHHCTGFADSLCGIPDSICFPVACRINRIHSLNYYSISTQHTIKATSSRSLLAISLQA